MVDAPLLREHASEIVPAAEMQHEMETTFAIVRTRLLGVPNKVKQRHRHLPLPILATIYEAIRKALEELADGHGTSDGRPTTT